MTVWGMDLYLHGLVTEFEEPHPHLHPNSKQLPEGWLGEAEPTNTLSCSIPAHKATVLDYCSLHAACLCTSGWPQFSLGMIRS